ncbi:unnamed protein product [Aphanomyces euteiches]
MKIAVVASVVASIVALSAAVQCTSDAVINDANNVLVARYCITDFRGDTDPTTIGVAFQDYVNNPNSIYTYGLCGVDACVRQINGLSYPTCTPTAATSYAAAISNFSTTCAALNSALATGGGTCSLVQMARYRLVKYNMPLTPNCSAALAKFSYSSTSQWSSVASALSLTSNDVTNAFCASPDCVQLTNQALGWFINAINCALPFGENLMATASNIMNYCSSSPPTNSSSSNPTIVLPTTTFAPPTTCDASINAANNWTLSQACTNDLQGGSPPSLSAIYADIAARSSTTVYRYGLCGSTNCAADIAKIVNSYPNCTATTAPSLLTWVQGYAPTCVAVNASIANSTCTLANYADYNWARYQVQLTPQCANALSMSTSSLWYSAIQAAALSNNAFTNAFCTSSDCISFTTSTINMLGDCSVTSGENLFKTATNLINYCNAIAPTTPPAAKSSQPSTTAATSGGTTTATPTPTPTKSSASTAFGMLAVGVVASGMLLLA